MRRGKRRRMRRGRRRKKPHYHIVHNTAVSFWNTILILSIKISWLTRESAIPSLVALTQQKVEFMRHVGVLRLTIGEVTVFEEEREEGEEKEEEEGVEEEEEEKDVDLNPALIRATTTNCEEARCGITPHPWNRPQLYIRRCDHSSHHRL